MISFCIIENYLSFSVMCLLTTLVVEIEIIKNKIKNIYNQGENWRWTLPDPFANKNNKLGFHKIDSIYHILCVSFCLCEIKKKKTMAMRNFLNGLKGLKVKDVPGHVKPMVTTSNAKNFIQRSLDNYHAKYIQTDSIVPLYHVCFGGMIFSYLVALPEERRHLEHKQHAAAH